MVDVNPSLPLQPSRALSRSALAARAYDAMKCMILDQEIAPGAHLAIDALAQSLGVSPTPVREALARLEGDGLIVREDNGRLRVALPLDRAAFEELYAVRLEIEPLAASLAAGGASDAELAGLRDCIAQITPAAGSGSSADYAAFVTADAAFHETIARGGRNRFLADTVRHLHIHHRLAFLYRRRGIVDWQVAGREHAQIADAIAARAPERAAHLMRAHIERSRDVLRTGFGNVTLLETAAQSAPPATPA